MNILFILFIAFLYAWVLRNAYIAWFQSGEYFKIAIKDRRTVDRIAPFISKIWSLKLITDHPKVDLWWARIGSLFMVLISTIALIAAIFIGTDN